MEKLDAENWKHTLVGLCFQAKLASDQLINSNNQSKELYLHVLDISENIKHALPESQSALYRLYDTAIQKMCKHYQKVYDTMATDMNTVKTWLLNEFHS